ncbi:hypothetical protein KW786_02960 [Candidatus Parcubacteria bacterium]|nr:hypothetical protein [Candidatus Parcubacteria bacterium]
MKINITGNKYIDAALALMLFSAAAHMAILFFLAIAWRDIYILNYFNILDVDLLIPYDFNNLASNAAALAVAVLIYIIILKTNKLS